MSSVPRSPRVVRASILASAGVGLGLLLLFAWTDGSLGVNVPSEPLALARLWVIVVVPASLPMTVVGGLVAARALALEPTGRPLFAWASGGILGGALLGAVGCVGWYVVHSARASFSIIPIFGFIGAVAGAIVGVMVGTYCWRAGRRPAATPG